VTVTEDEIDKLLATIMSPQEQRELGDLTTTAIERTRRTVMLVGQLIEQDALRAAMISAVAFDMLRGAAGLLADATGRPQPEMFDLIIDGIQAKARKNDRAQGLQRHHQGDGGNVRSGRQAYRKMRRLMAREGQVFRVPVGQFNYDRWLLTDEGRGLLANKPRQKCTSVKKSPSRPPSVAF
jgi:hypothetical protein